MKDIVDDRVVATVPSSFHREWILENYGDVLKASVEAICGPSGSIDVEVLPRTGTSGSKVKPVSSPTLAGVAAGAAAAIAPKAAKAVQGPSTAPLTPGYEFSRFIVGKSTDLAKIAAESLSNPEFSDFSVLLIQGGVGFGKSHLLQATCRAAAQNTSWRTAYIRAEQFINDFVQALSNQETQKFRRQYRDLDFVCFDDLHILAEKEKTQQEFLHTLVAWRDRGTRVALAGRCNPGETLPLNESLLSQLSASFSVSLRMPETETRKKIVAHRAALMGYEISDEVAGFFAELPVGNLRELEGAITSAIAGARLTGSPLTVRSARASLQHDSLLSRPISSPDRIVRVVCDHFEVRVADISSRRRPQALSFARQIAMFLLRERTELSLSEIGEFLGGRDHTTVLHGIRKINEAVQSDRRVQDHLARIRHQLDH